MEYVVLVDEKNNVLGTRNKADVHRENTPLHRAFSVFIFDNKQRLLLQQRAVHKKTWPLVWSNSCCGHPMLTESNIEAVKRRCQFELGIDVFDILEVAPYRYCFSYQGVMENEICPILVVRYNGELNINTDEVKSTQWIHWKNWLQQIETSSNLYSQWCIEESYILERSKIFKEWLSQNQQFCTQE